MSDDPSRIAARLSCSKCGGAGTIWNPTHRMGWPRSVSCPKCDGWNKAAAARTTEQETT